MIESEVQGSECAEAVGFSYGDFGLVVQPLDDAAGKINVVRIMMATEPKLITITVDGELSAEYVDAVETSARQALAQRRPTQLFLPDDSAIDGSGRALLARLAAKGVRLRAGEVYFLKDSATRLR